jgi:hypothetical protein
MAIFRSLIPALLFVVGSAAAASAEPSVALEVVMDKGAGITAPQQWMAALKDLGFSNIRVRQGELGDRPEVKTLSEGPNASYRVVAVVNGNSLYFSNARFGMGDKAGISNWLAKLKGGGQEGLNARPAAFGLSAKELVALHESLAAPVGIATKGQKAGQVITQIQRTSKARLVVNPLAQKALTSEEVIADEVRELSTGAGLAAILRPLGLVLVPKKGAAGIDLTIVDFRATEESWPVGWPPEKEIREVMPKFTEFLTVEIDNIPLTDALTAIGKRLETPILFDHNSLARQKIDPAAVKVTLPEGKTYYKKILDRLLFQAKLNMEVRVDEAGKPLLWISTLKRN